MKIHAQTPTKPRDKSLWYYTCTPIQIALNTKKMKRQLYTKLHLAQLKTSNCAHCKTPQTQCAGEELCCADCTHLY